MAVRLDEGLEDGAGRMGDQAHSQAQLTQQAQQAQQGETRAGRGLAATPPLADREDLAHWSRALEAMQLSADQLAQLILLLQVGLSRANTHTTQPGWLPSKH